MVIGTPTVLNLIPGKVFPIVNVNQYDAGYQKTFLLYKGAEPFNIAANMAVTIRGTKGDRNGIADSAASTVGSNLVSVTLTEQMTAVAGPNIYELRIADMNGFLVGTVNFIMMVEPAALGDGTVISDSDLNYAADVLDKIQTEEATKNQVNANTADINTLKADVAEHAEDIAGLQDNVDVLNETTPNTTVYADTTAHGKISIPDGYSCGGCALDDTKTYLYVGVYKVSDDSGAYIAKIRYSDITGSVEGSTITPESTIPLGSTKSHMNSLCYYNGKIYIGAYRNDIGNSYNNINIVDLSDNSVSTVALPIAVTVSSVAVLVIDEVVNVIALEPDYTTYQVWQIFNNVAMPVYSIMPEVNGWYIAQDIHVSQSAIYQLEGGSYDGGEKVGIDQIQVMTMDGRLSSFVYLNNSEKHGELEGITKEPGLDKFVLVNNEGSLFTTEPKLILKDRDVFNIYMFKLALNATHQLFPALSDTITNVCTFGTNTLGKRYPRLFTVPVRAHLCRGYTIAFTFATFVAAVSILGESMFVNMKFVLNNILYELLFRYNQTVTNIGKRSGYTTYSIGEDDTRIMIKALDSSIAPEWHTGINAINRIPQNIGIVRDAAMGMAIDVGYLTTAELGI